MKVVVGLGNPGERYAATRHNVGFWVIDELARRWQVRCDRQRFHALTGEFRLGKQQILLCKPQTFMNLSGQAVEAVVSYYNQLDIAEDLIVVYDDMDFPPGRIRLRQQGSAGGHNGLKSVIQHLGTEVFPRVRVGIGRPDSGRSIVDHVLSPFSATERVTVTAAVGSAADAVEFALRNSFTLAMNRFNVSNQSAE